MIIILHLNEIDLKIKELLALIEITFRLRHAQS